MSDNGDERDRDAGVPDTDPDHLDPAGDLAGVVEENIAGVDLKDTDPEDLREFISRAEAGEFGADPGVEATVRIARAILENAEEE